MRMRGWMGVDRHLRDGAAPLLLPSCPREWGAEMAAPPFEQGLGALGGAARMGAGMQPAVAGAPPFIHTGVLPPSLLPCPRACAKGLRRTRGHANQGEPREAGTPPTLCVCTTPRAFRVHDPCAPPFRCHAPSSRMRDGVRRVACERWGAKGLCMWDDAWGCAHTPFPVMCEREALQRENMPFAQSPSLSPFPPTLGQVRGCAAPAVQPFPHKRSRAAGVAGQH